MQAEQKRALLAVVISAIIIFAWQYFFPTKPAVAPIDNSPQAQINTPVNQPIEGSTNSGAKKVNLADSISLKTNIASYTVNSSLAVLEASNENQAFDFRKTVGESGFFQPEFLIDGKYQLINFNLKKINESTLQAVSSVVQIQMNIDEKGKLIVASSSSVPTKIRFRFASSEGKDDALQPRKFSYLLNNEYNNEEVDAEEKGEGSFKWAGIDFYYHLFAVIFPEPTSGVFNIQNNSMNFAPAQQYQNFTYKVIFTKKELNILKGLGDNLNLSIDFGFFSFIAEPLLSGLQFLYKYLKNYGWSIILLTFLIRLLLFPLQASSFKSMKKMQLLGPEMKKIKAKYEGKGQEAQMKMQQETMGLYKKHGVNPLGGCLPMVLQMPVFFAFFTVLQNSVELVGAPWMAWIMDLSAKDPYYVLPILMGVFMLIQQLVSPSSASMDPMQKKMMMVMPLVFTFILKDYPAGLSLYMITSSLFGIFQQFLVNRSTEAVA